MTTIKIESFEELRIIIISVASSLGLMNQDQN